MMQALPELLLRLGRDLRAHAFALGLLAAAPTLAADLSALAAAPLAVELGAGRPALVVLWSPGCMVCRKSLAEIERFIPMAAQDGITVRTVVPDAVFDDARAMLARRKLTLPVVADGDRLDTPTLRILLDSPLAYAVDRDGRIVAARGGLLGVQVLEGLVAAVHTPASEGNTVSR